MERKGKENFAPFVVEKWPAPGITPISSSPTPPKC
jgi:hypothetical protein